MLRMDNFDWLKVRTYGDEPPRRAGFASALADSELIIFGGVKEDFSAASDTFIIELSSEKIKKIIEETQKS